MPSSKYLHFVSCDIINETEKALQIDITTDDDVIRKWVPKSVIADCDDHDVGDTDVTVSIEEWFVKKELEDIADAAE